MPRRMAAVIPPEGDALKYLCIRIILFKKLLFTILVNQMSSDLQSCILSAPSGIRPKIFFSSLPGILADITLKVEASKGKKKSLTR